MKKDVKKAVKTTAKKATKTVKKEVKKAVKPASKRVTKREKKLNKEKSILKYIILGTCVLFAIAWYVMYINKMDETMVSTSSDFCATELVSLENETILSCDENTITYKNNGLYDIHNEEILNIDTSKYRGWGFVICNHQTVIRLSLSEYDENNNGQEYMFLDGDKVNTSKSIVGSDLVCKSDGIYIGQGFPNVEYKKLNIDGDKLSLE